MPALKPGSFVLSSELATENVQIKAIALAFRENAVLGCQSFKGRISLHRDPTPDNDLGDGRLTALAVPLCFDSHTTILAETVKLGVLVLYDVPLRKDLGSVIHKFARLSSQSLAFSRHTYKDPLMGLRTESEIKNEISRQLNLFELTRGKLKGGLVFGLVDSLTHYKKTIETETEVGDGAASQFVLDILRGVGQCVVARSLQFPLDGDQVYRSGVPGRVGVNGFVCVLPLLKPDELVRFGRALQADVKEYRFPGESLLEQGAITLSVRIMSFPENMDVDTTWLLVRDEISEMYRDQSQARGTDRLQDFTETLRIEQESRWIGFDEWREARKAPPPGKAPPADARPSGAARRPGVSPGLQRGPGPGGSRPVLGQRGRGPGNRSRRRPSGRR